MHQTKKGNQSPVGSPRTLRKKMTTRPHPLLNTALAALKAGQWDDYVSMVKGIADLQEREALWGDLAGRHGVDLDLVAALVSWPAAKAALRYLAPVLGNVKGLTAPQVLDVLRYGAAAGREAGYRVPETLKKLFMTDNRIAETVGDNLRQDVAALEDNRWAQWASAFAQAAPEAAAAYAVALPLTSAQERLAAALLIERLATKSPAVQDALCRKDADMTRAFVQDAPKQGTDFSVHWAAVCHLADFSERAGEAVLQAARRGERPALIAVSNHLHGHSSSEFGATRTPLSEVLDLLLEKALVDEELRRRVADGSIASLLYNSKLRDTVVTAIEKLGDHDEPIAELFNESFSALAEEAASLHRVFTSWLVSPTASFSAIRSVLERYVGLRVPVGLDAALFMAAAPERKVAAVRRLLVLSLNGPALCSFAGLLAESPDFQPTGLDLAASMLQEVFVEYPGATDDFLQARLKEVSPSSPAGGVYATLHKRAEAWRQVLDALPRLNELRPSDTERLALNALQMRFGRDVSRRSEESSILELFATKVHMAQGRRFTSLFGPGAGQVTPTGEFSHTVEWPTSQVSDPLGALMRRNRMLRASR